MIPREYVTFYKSLKNIKYMLHCALLYHEISKMKTNILHKMYRIIPMKEIEINDNSW